MEKQSPTIQTPIVLNYEDTLSNGLANFMSRQLSNICVFVGLMMRIIFVLIIAITFGYIFVEMYKQGHDFVGLCIQYAIPAFLEIAFTLFSLVSAKMYGYGDNRSKYFFFGAILGLVYNGTQLWFLSDVLPFGDMNFKVQITLQVANFVAWGLVEGGALLTNPRKINNSVNQIDLQKQQSETTSETQNPVSDSETDVSDEEIENTQDFTSVGSISYIKPTYFIPKEFRVVGKTECIADGKLWNLKTAYKLYHIYKDRFERASGNVQENERKSYYLAYLIRHTENGTQITWNNEFEKKPDYPLPNVVNKKPINGKKILNGQGQEV
ncbi:hypothetical protein ACE193_15365 [Bernardetia sp. OM2101]|uniref:hypothetical protein n=1 Tax=Bernardetia sp. OM2101 TaxID=3344876 RepID=UPI0035CF9423